MAFDQRVIDAGPWSLSKASTLSTCVRQFEFKYVQKAKEGAKSTQSRVGVSAHTIQEYALNRASSFEALQEFTRECIEKDGLTHAESVEVISKLPGVMDFARKVSDLKAQYGVLDELVETKLAMTALGEKADFFHKNVFMRGVLDYGLITSSRVMLLVDHKSGKRKRITEHAPQFYTYMLLALACYPDIIGVQCAINYFGSPELDWFPRFNGESGPWSRDEIIRIAAPWLEKHLNQLTKRLTILDNANPPPETGWQCEYCGYVDRCTEGAEHAAKRRAKRDGTSNI